MSATESSKIYRKILLHPGEFVIPRRIYRDCKAVDAETMMIRMNELVDEHLGSLVQRTQQQTIFYKTIPSADIEESLKNHAVSLRDYRVKFYQVDYKCGERQREAIHRANPERIIIDAMRTVVQAENDNE